MTDALMPEYGAKRNREIAEMLGWKNMHYSHGVEYGHAPGSVFITAIPDFCRDDAACFSLLVTLHSLEWVFQTALHHWHGKYHFTLETSGDVIFPSRTRNLTISSAIPGADGLRDAITQAAWLALTAANKETE